MPLNEKPDHAFVESVRGRLASIWSAAHENWRSYDSYYWREFNVWDRADHRRVRPSHRPSTPANTVDHAVDNQIAFEPTVDRPAVGNAEGAEEEADRLENWVFAQMKEASRHEPTLIWKAIGKYILHYGYAVVEGPVLDMSGEARKPKRLSDEDNDEFDQRMQAFDGQMSGSSPIRIHAPHPSKVLMNPGETDPSMVVKKSRRFAIDLEEVTRQKKRQGKKLVDVFDRGKLKPYDEVSVTELWSPFWHSLFADGVKGANDQRMFIERNTLGFVPYAQGFSTFGMERTETARVNSSLNPRWLAIGLLEHIRDSIKMDAQRISSQQQLLVRAAWTPMGVSQNVDPAEFAQQLARGIIQGEEGDYWILQSPDVQRWMFAHGEDLLRDIEAGTVARASRGAREPGVSTVGQQAILSNAAGKKFIAPQQVIEQLATATAQKMLFLLEVLGRVIKVGGAEGRPADVKRNYSISVRFEVIDPAAHMQSREIGMREVAQGLKSPETYRENDLRIKNESEERRRLGRERVRQLPAVQIAQNKEYAEEMGLLETLQALGEPKGGLVDAQGRSLGKPTRQPLDNDTTKPAPRTIPA